MVRVGSREAFFFGLILAITGAVSAAPGDGKSKAPEFANQKFDRAAAMRERAETHAWLMSEAVNRGRSAALEATPDPAARRAIDDAPRLQAPELVGLTESVATEISFEDLSPAMLRGQPLNRALGAVQGTADGGYVYTLTLRSAGATALRIHFDQFSLPEGASVFLYTEDGQAFGPYAARGPQGNGEFWSHTVMGEELSLQLRQIGPVSGRDLGTTRLRISELGHLRPRYLGFCSGNAGCVQNIECGNTDPDINDAKNAIAHMQWVSGGFIYICTGGLLADTDSGSEVPLFLTANHCLSRDRDAASLENFFQYTKPCGTGGDCDDLFDTRANHPQGLRTLGASVLSTSRNTDHTLLQLSESAPAGSAYLGWTSSPIAETSGAKLIRTSHPNGAPQAYSEHEVDTDSGTCRKLPRGNFIYSTDTYGGTEGGSSGSPVLNDAGQVVGQLFGACGFNVSDSCDSVSNNTVDGALAAYFSSVESYLDPGNACVPSPEVCDDSIDNDCDGFIDGLDPDCDDGGGGGLPKGASCSVNSDCASNKCKGKPGSKTCG